MLFSKNKEYRGKIIQNSPYTDEILDYDMGKCDNVKILHSSKYRQIKRFIDDFHQYYPNEEIVYIHRYKKEGDCFIGVKELKKLSYFI